MNVLRENLLIALRDHHEDVKEYVIDVLLLFAKQTGGVQTIIQAIVQAIVDSPEFFENFGLFVVRSLCRFEAAETVYTCLASSLLELKDKSFNGQFVQMLNWLLMTGEETVSLRKRLRGCAYWTHPKKEEDVKLFDDLYVKKGMGLID